MLCIFKILFISYINHILIVDTVYMQFYNFSPHFEMILNCNEEIVKHIAREDCTR